jgi:hypothetical protein
MPLGPLEIRRGWLFFASLTQGEQDQWASEVLKRQATERDLDPAGPAAVARDYALGRLLELLTKPSDEPPGEAGTSQPG